MGKRIYFIQLVFLVTNCGFTDTQSTNPSSQKTEHQSPNLTIGTNDYLTEDTLRGQFAINPQAYKNLVDSLYSKQTRSERSSIINHDIFHKASNRLRLGRNFVTTFDFEKLDSVEVLSISIDLNFAQPNHQIIIMNFLNDSISKLSYTKISKDLATKELDGLDQTNHHFIYRYNSQIIWTNSRRLNINIQNEIVGIVARKNGIDNPYGLWSEYFYGPVIMEERYICRSCG